MQQLLRLGTTFPLTRMMAPCMLFLLVLVSASAQSGTGTGLNLSRYPVCKAGIFAYEAFYPYPPSRSQGLLKKLKYSLVAPPEVTQSKKQRFAKVCDISMHGERESLLNSLLVNSPNILHSEKTCYNGGSPLKNACQNFPAGSGSLRLLAAHSSAAVLNSPGDDNVRPLDILFSRVPQRYTKDSEVHDANVREFDHKIIKVLRVMGEHGLEVTSNDVKIAAHISIPGLLQGVLEIWRRSTGEKQATEEMVEVLVAAHAGNLKSATFRKCAMVFMGTGGVPKDMIMEFGQAQMDADQHLTSQLTEQ